MTRKEFHLKINSKIIMAYLIGNLILALGICLNTESALGVSPVSSVVFNVSQISGLSFALVNFIYLTALIFVQYLLLPKEFKGFDLLQILASMLSSFFIQIFDNMLSVPQDLLGRIIFLFMGIILTGIGASLTVGMNVIPNPADALAHVVGRKLKRSFGVGKNVMDLGMIGLAIIIGLLLKGSLLGVGIGTVLSMILTGRVIALIHPWTEKTYEQLKD